MIGMSDDIVDDAAATFKAGYSCSQAVLSAFAEKYGLDKETALRVSGAFGGGVSGRGDACGAVTGALMVIGLKYGKVKADDEATKQKTYALANEFMAQFKARNGSIVCRDLLGYDMGTPEGKKLIAEKKLTSTLCPKYVRDAIEILQDIL